MKQEFVTPSIGVKLLEIDLSSKLNSIDIKKITDLIADRKVVLFENQEISDHNFEEFAFKFGPPFTPDKSNPVLGSHENEGSIIVVGNNAPEYKNTYLGHQEVLPHSDHQWLKMPSSMSMLYSIQIGSDSAPTKWTNMAVAYEMLDSQIKSRIENVKMITYNPFHRPFGSLSSKYVNSKQDIPPGQQFPHPLVRIHPITGEKLLYFNLAYEVEFVGMSYCEGLELFELLNDHMFKLDCSYTHFWKPKDLIIWDNRATIHYRPSFNKSTQRVLKRITIAGEIPF